MMNRPFQRADRAPGAGWAGESSASQRDSPTIFSVCSGKLSFSFACRVHFRSLLIFTSQCDIGAGFVQVKRKEFSDLIVGPSGLREVIVSPRTLPLRHAGCCVSPLHKEVNPPMLLVCALIGRQAGLVYKGPPRAKSVNSLDKSGDVQGNSANSHAKSGDAQRKSGNSPSK
jgi:hypothetical protein